VVELWIDHLGLREETAEAPEMASEPRPRRPRQRGRPGGRRRFR